MSAPRAVRIPRVRAEGPSRSAVRTTSPPEPARRAGAVERRTNVAGTQRAVRLALVYLGAIGLLYLVFFVLERAARGGSGTGAELDLLLFGIVALAFALGGALFALHPAPRAIEIAPSAFVVVGRWGRRTEWSPRNEVKFRVVRRFPAGLLSHAPVESVELSVAGRPPRAYFTGEGFFPIPGADGARRP